mgnify:CR=1 FL=1
MRQIRVLCVGKKQEPYLKTGIDVYQKKLQRYCRFELIPLKEANYGKGSKLQWQRKEQKEIESQYRPQTYIIACDEKGETLSSPQLADKLKSIANQGFSKIDFVVGGPFGLPQEIKAGSHLMLSLSSMTLTHQMIRLLLAEQIYRAFTIIKGEKYHH